MKNGKILTIFLVDDDPMFLKSLEIDFLNQNLYNIETFLNGEDCLSNLHHHPDFIILDYLLDGIHANSMNGIEVLDKILAYNPTIPVIILSAQDKIEVAVNCMHHKAADYIVKSETSFLRINQIILSICKQQKMEKIIKWYMDRL
ncbi:MAG: response regulator [Bacteroidota bacterium]|nr:response regulator [Bacteroidota bacterium]